MLTYPYYITGVSLQYLSRRWGDVWINKDCSLLGSNVVQFSSLEPMNYSKILVPNYENNGIIFQNVIFSAFNSLTLCRP
jgi:hypothetical protein